MDIKSEVESSEVIGKDGQGLKEIQEIKHYENNDFEEEFEIKAEEPFEMKEEYTENDQPIEEIFELDGSQILISDVEHEEEGNSHKTKSFIRNSPQTSRRHNQLIKKKELKGLCCTSCDISFKSKGELKSHLKTHHKRKFGCPHCHYESDYKSALERHVRVHSDKKLFKCSECNYGCIFKGNLKRHMLTHSNRKLFKCSECDHECNEKGNLKQHMLTHVNFRFFKCSECIYECKQKRYLKQHMLTHADFKLFKCSECSYECNNKGNLKSHMLTTHADFILFKCSECSYEGNIERSFKRHLSVHARKKVKKTDPSNRGINMKMVSQ